MSEKAKKLAEEIMKLFVGKAYLVSVQTQTIIKLIETHDAEILAEGRELIERLGTALKIAKDNLKNFGRNWPQIEQALEALSKSKGVKP